MTMLGYCYQSATGTKVDMEKAVELFKKAANLGHEVAQYNLALSHENGDGIEKDIDQAIYWYEQSGFQNAKSRLKNLKAADI
jgi:TPR repeat protein